MADYAIVFSMEIKGLIESEVSWLKKHIEPPSEEEFDTWSEEQQQRWLADHRVEEVTDGPSHDYGFYQSDCQHSVNDEDQKCCHGLAMGTTCEKCILRCRECWDEFDSSPTFGPRPEAGGLMDLVIKSEESANIDYLAFELQEFLKEFRPDEFIGFDWSNWCSSRRTDGFGGGAIFITAKESKSINTFNWLEQQEELWRKRMAKKPSAI